MFKLTISYLNGHSNECEVQEYTCIYAYEWFNALHAIQERSGFSREEMMGLKDLVEQAFFNNTPFKGTVLTDKNGTPCLGVKYTKLINGV